MDKAWTGSILQVIFERQRGAEELVIQEAARIALKFGRHVNLVCCQKGFCLLAIGLRGLGEEDGGAPLTDPDPERNL